MKKLFLFLAGVLPAALYAQIPAAATDLSYAAAKALPAVVRVQAFVSDSLWNIHPELVIKGIKTPRSGSGMLTGSASGVLVSAEGAIMTNAHVLAGGDSLVVILPDRRVFHALLIGTDNQADLALLKIRADGLPFLELGDPVMVQLGDPVLAVGNPLELTSTVTAGILSARFRGMDDLLNASWVNSYLQSDAASNEGMSGSALVDRNGKLIGINSAIISPSGTFAGYAFAIPSGIVKKAWQDLSRYGQARHAYLDIIFSDMNAGQAERLFAPDASGVLTEDLQKGGAGERAGLHRDDILLQLDRQLISNAAQLRELLAQHDPGDQVSLTVRRRAELVRLTAILSPGAGGQAAARNKGQSGQPVIRTYQQH